MSVNLARAALAVQSAIQSATDGLVERQALVEAIVLSLVAREHMLVVGPPGTAKSEAVRRIAHAVGGSYFEYLVGRFTEPSELFGPVDLRKLREGRVETETTGMLPEAEIAFLDEVFLGSTAILNTLLALLNERVFRRGHTVIRCPLRVCVGAANALPDDEMLSAFADRFLVRIFVDPLPDSSLEDLLQGGRSIREWKDGGQPLLTEIDVLANAAGEMNLAAIQPLLAQGIRLLRRAGVYLSDRRVVKIQSLIAAAAALRGEPTANEADLWPMILAIPKREEQTIAREVLRELLINTENIPLNSVAEDASRGPLARGARLVAEAAIALQEAPDPNSDRYFGWTLRLEGIAREIDAGFSHEQLSPELFEVRNRIKEIIVA